MHRKHALVTGGSGAVGSEVVKALRGAGLDVDFTFLRSTDRARALAAESGARPHEVDLRDGARLNALVARLAEQGPPVDVLVHAAAVHRSSSASEADWDDTFAVNVRPAFLLCKALPLASQGGEVVLLGALDRAQSLPLSASFAASQGALSALAMAMAKELGPRGVRVNLLALGPLEAGLSRELDPRLIENFKTFSALRRLGRPAEVARVVRWLALENSYLSGKTIPVNGGI